MDNLVEIMMGLMVKNSDTRNEKLFQWVPLYKSNYYEKSINVN